MAVHKAFLLKGSINHPWHPFDGNCYAGLGLVKGIIYSSRFAKNW